MGRALGDVLPLAVAVAVFPVPIVAAVLLLGSAGGKWKGLAFAAAWFAGLLAVGAAGLLLAGAIGPTDGSEPATWVSFLLLALGLMLLGLAVKEWWKRPRRRRSRRWDTRAARRVSCSWLSRSSPCSAC